MKQRKNGLTQKAVEPAKNGREKVIMTCKRKKKGSENQLLRSYNYSSITGVLVCVDCTLKCYRAARNENSICNQEK
jgi:hypothetical protein